MNHTTARVGRECTAEERLILARFATCIPQAVTCSTSASDPGTFVLL
jgi:hypothetical protein